MKHQVRAGTIKSKKQADDIAKLLLTSGETETLVSNFAASANGTNQPLILGLLGPLRNIM